MLVARILSVCTLCGVCTYRIHICYNKNPGCTSVEHSVPAPTIYSIRMHDVWPHGKYQRIEWRATSISVRLRHIYFSSLTIHNSAHNININIDGHGDTCRRAAVNIIPRLKNIRSTAMTTSTTSSTMAFHQIK